MVVEDVAKRHACGATYRALAIASHKGDYCLSHIAADVASAPAVGERQRFLPVPAAQSCANVWPARLVPALAARTTHVASTVTPSPNRASNCVMSRATW